MPSIVYSEFVEMRQQEATKWWRLIFGVAITKSIISVFIISICWVTFVDRLIMRMQQNILFSNFLERRPTSDVFEICWVLPRSLMTLLFSESNPLMWANFAFNRAWQALARSLQSVVVDMKCVDQFRRLHRRRRRQHISIYHCVSVTSSDRSSKRRRDLNDYRPVLYWT